MLASEITIVILVFYNNIIEFPKMSRLAFFAFIVYLMKWKTTEEYINYSRARRKFFI